MKFYGFKCIEKFGIADYFILIMFYSVQCFDKEKVEVLRRVE